MNDRPIIGVNLDVNVRSGELSVPVAYVDQLVRVGAVPVLLPPAGDRPSEPAAGAVLSWLDGLLLIGGADPDPLLQRCQRTRWNTSIMAPRREHFDRWLIGEARARKIPLLAIGAGMQLLNVACGGTLFYEISKDLPKALPHADPLDPGHRHAMVVKEGTLMEQVFGEGDAPICVTSQHHQAVDHAAPGFHVTARSRDGVVEAIESKDLAWLAVGVQFHPESPYASRLEQWVFDLWIERLRGATKTVET